MAWNEAAVTWMQDALQHGFGAMMRPRATRAQIFAPAQARYESRMEINWQFEMGEEADARDELLVKVGAENWQPSPANGRMHLIMPGHDLSIQLRHGPNLLAQQRVSVAVIQPTVRLFLANAATDDGYAEVELYANDALSVTVEFNGIRQTCSTRSLVRVPVALSSQSIEARVVGVAGTHARTSLAIPGLAPTSAMFSRDLAVAIRARG